MSSALVLDSLRRRMAAMFSLYEDAVSTMDLEHVNHFEREGVLPIAFSLFHYVNMHDASFMLITGQTPIWNDDWHARVMPAINDHGKHRTVDEMVGQRLGDLVWRPRCNHRLQTAADALKLTADPRGQTFGLPPYLARLQ